MLLSQYRVTELAKSGSAVRDPALDASDIDIMINFDGPATSDRDGGVVVRDIANVSHAGFNKPYR